MWKSETSLAISYGYIYSLHLLQSINDDDILRRVLQAVTRNGSSLMAVFGFLIKLIYIYTLFAFAFMRSKFDPEEGMQCEYVWQCIVTGVRSGLMSGGGLGEALTFDGVRSVPLLGEHTDMVRHSTATYLFFCINVITAVIDYKPILTFRGEALRCSFSIHVAHCQTYPSVYHLTVGTVDNDVIFTAGHVRHVESLV